MADPLAIVGLVSNLISFVDFGIKFAAGTQELRNSFHGTIPEVQELELIVRDVQRYNKLVDEQKSSGKAFSVHEQHIFDMVRQCERICKELSKMIAKLQVRERRLKTLESGRVAFLSLWKQKDMKNLRDRLEIMDKRIRDSVGGALMSENVSAISTSLASIKSTQHDLGMDHDAKLEMIRDDIVALVQRNRSNETSTQIAELASLKMKLDILKREHTACIKQTKVIRSLYFPVLLRRWNQIPGADRASNEWIFDMSLTPFKNWLGSKEPSDGLFCITGRAGSGKSTLLKYVSDESRTTKSLQQWASPAKLCTASYYFWNQGYEMQKNQVGLLQSLVYQILKSVPRLISVVCIERLEHEVWEMIELKTIFMKIAAQSDLEVKFCFFIDGLDEYNGAEEDIVEVLKFLSASKDIKICASTRPRSVFERFFCNVSRTFDIADFTKADMGRHVQLALNKNENFRRLESAEFTCKEMMEVIANLARGVWLWVFLITRDLTYAVNRDEGVVMLRKIVHQFPPDLEAYFERMIGSVRRQYLEEMSQIFLITVDELQPLPLYAFSLLEDLRENADYAVNAPIKPLQEEQIFHKYPAWKSLIQNRCSDLLIVDREPHPLFLSHSVDFLHRTVRDFLQDNYQSQLRRNLKSDFNSTATLCKMCLVLLKSLPSINFKSSRAINKVFGLTDELLYYAYETERTDESPHTSLLDVLDEVDRINSHHARNIKNHWTHARDSVPARGLDVYREGNTCNFLALAVQARLVKYVRAKLEVDLRKMGKKGRPLLDYALRPRRSTPVSMPYHSKRDDPSVNVEMVALLLKSKADPNQPVHLNDGKTVWGLFLLSVHESVVRSQGSTIALKIPPTLTNAWYQCCELLIQAGANADCILAPDRLELTVRGIWEAAFGIARADVLQKLMDEKAQEIQTSQGKSSCALM